MKRITKRTKIYDSGLKPDIISGVKGEIIKKMLNKSFALKR